MHGKVKGKRGTTKVSCEGKWKNIVERGFPIKVLVFWKNRENRENIKFRRVRVHLRGNESRLDGFLRT